MELARAEGKDVARYIVAAIFLCGILAGIALKISRSAPPIEVSAPAPSLLIDPDALEAQAAIVYDPAQKRVLFGKNAQMQLPLASLTKLMTSETALSGNPASMPVTLSKKAIETEGDSGLLPGETWSLGTLIKYGLLVSSNDAMAAVAESEGGESFVARMNTEAQELGLSQSYFLDPTGLDVTQSVSGGYGSAQDVALLASIFWASYPSYFEATTQNGKTFGTSTSAVSGTATAQPILDLPGIIAAKTGYTDLAGGNLVAIFDSGLGHPLVGVVLHSTESGRFSDMRALIAAARASEQQENP